MVLVRFFIFSLTLQLLIMHNPVLSQAEEQKLVYLQNQDKSSSYKSLPKNINFRGWEHLVSKLYNKGVPIKDLQYIYASGRMPKFTKVSFSVAPKEGANIYRHFDNHKRINRALKFLNQHKSIFDTVAEKYNVEPELITSIMLIESDLGRNTGKHPIIYRLSRLGNISAPDNVQKNYQRLLKDGEEVTFQDVYQRSLYLENTFLPEIIAILAICEENKLSPFGITGSSAGAFGLSQFLPSSYLRYAIDHNKNGKRSLYEVEDAIASIGNYFTKSGWKKEPHRDVIWKYNKSDAYIDTVLKVYYKLLKLNN